MITGLMVTNEKNFQGAARVVIGEMLARVMGIRLVDIFFIEFPDGKVINIWLN